MLKNELDDIRIKDEQHFYGIYRGVVEDDNPEDAQKDGRIHVRVWGVHTPYKETDTIKGINVIPTNELPLAQPAYPVIIGSITGKGCWSVPCQGTHVFVFFENGDPMQPRYFATVPGIQPESMTFDSNLGFTDPDGADGYPLDDMMGEPDMNRLMRGDSVEGTAWEEITSTIFPPCPPTLPDTHNWEPGEHTATYPDNFVIETRDKQTLEMNDNATLLYHNDETFMLMKEDSLLIKGTLDVDGGMFVNGTVDIHSTLRACLVYANNLNLNGNVSNFVEIFNNHTHGGGSIPDQQI